MPARALNMATTFFFSETLTTRPRTNVLTLPLQTGRAGETSTLLA